MSLLTIVDHPLLARHLSLLRAVQAGREQLRASLAEAAGILAHEAMRDIQPEDHRESERGHVRPGLGDAGDRIFGT